METTIKSISIINGDRFQVLAIILGNEEVSVFMPGTTATEIKDWVLDRKSYYEDVKLRELELQEQLVGIEL